MRRMAAANIIQGLKDDDAAIFLRAPIDLSSSEFFFDSRS